MPAAKRTKNLGTQIAVYRCRPFGGIGFKLLLLWGGLSVLAPLGYGFYRAMYAYTKYGPVAARFWSRPWYLLAGVALLLFIILLGQRLRRARHLVAVHQNGLRLHLSRRQELLWGHISGIAAGAVESRLLGKTLRLRHRAELYPAIGAPIRLDDGLENLPELITRIKANLYPRLLPDMRQAFKEGKRLYFGALSISPAELRLQKKGSQPIIIPWEEVEEVTVQAGVLVVKAKDNAGIRLPVARVPNLELLLQIIQSGVNV